MLNEIWNLFQTMVKIIQSVWFKKKILFPTASPHICNWYTFIQNRIVKTRTFHYLNAPVTFRKEAFSPFHALFSFYFLNMRSFYSLLDRNGKAKFVDLNSLFFQDHLKFILSRIWRVAIGIGNMCPHAGFWCHIINFGNAW